MHLLLLANLASAGPDTGDGECPLGAVPLEGTLESYDCVLSADPLDACAAVREDFRSAGCPTWDTFGAFLDEVGSAAEYWSLTQCGEDGHHARTSLGEVGYELRFDPSGALASYRTICSSSCSGYCCSGTSTIYARTGEDRPCDAATVWDPVDDTGEPPAEDPATPAAGTSGCGCDQAAVASPWWLVALVAFRRRARRVAR